MNKKMGVPSLSSKLQNLLLNPGLGDDDSQGSWSLGQVQTRISLVRAESQDARASGVSARLP